MNRKRFVSLTSLVCFGVVIVLALNNTLRIHSTLSLPYTFGNQGSSDDTSPLSFTADNFGANSTSRSNENSEQDNFDGCCPPAHMAGKMKNDDQCKTICLTERACRDNAYPFNSQEEKASFTYEPNRDTIKQLRTRCAVAMDKKMTFNWCRTSVDESESESKAVNIFPTSIPAGCSRFSQGGRSGPYQNMLVFPVGKLAFCGIPKAGITQWKQFLRFTFGARDYLSLPHYKVDTKPFHFDNLSPDVQSSIWMDPSWTKAVFLRDPAERLLSAYLDKKGMIKRVFEKVGIDVATFADFVDVITKSNVTCKSNNGSANTGMGLTWCSDPHWRPQAFSCGLNELLPNFQFIGSLDHVGDQTRILLDRVGMWETYGKRYMSKKKGNGDSICKVIPPKQNRSREGVGETFTAGFQQLYARDGSDGSDVYGHVKSAKAKFDQYYSPVLLEKVKRAYAMDYQLWNALQLPSNYNGTDGKNLAVALNAECR